MPVEIYNYSDFVNNGGVVDVSILDEEISVSAIGTNALAITADDLIEQVSITFAITLNTTEKIILNNIVTNHSAASKTDEIDSFPGGVELSGSNISDVSLINNIDYTLQVTNTNQHIGDNNNPHATGVGNLSPGTLAQLNIAVTNATLDDVSSPRPPDGGAGGDLAGIYPVPLVKAFTSGSTQITFNNIPDGFLLQRSSNSIIGVTASVPITDHGLLTGLDGPDHPQYATTSSLASVSNSISGHLSEQGIHFLSGAISHNDLLDLTVGDAHQQYSLLDGSKPFSGNVSIGGNNLQNINSITANRITGSHTEVSSGIPFIIGEGNVSVTTSGNGQTIISGSGGGDTKEIKVSAIDATPGFLEAKLIAGNDITITKQSSGGAEALVIDVSSSNGPADFFSAYDSTGGASPTGVSFIDIPFSGEHKKTSIFTHTIGSPIVAVTSDGTYVIHGYVTIEQPSGNSRTECDSRLMYDSGSGFAEVPGTRNTNYSRNVGQGGNTSAFTIILDLLDGDKLKMQINKTGGAGVVALYANGSGLTIHSVVGQKGDTGSAGAPGGSTVQIENNNLLVTNASSILNFGTNLSATDNGSGKVTIDNTNVFGRNFSHVSSNIVSSTTSMAPQVKLSLGPITLPAGTYKLEITYGWNHDSKNSDFISIIEQNDGSGFVQLGESHQQEIKDESGTFLSTGTNQRNIASKFIILIIGGGQYSWRLAYSTSDVAALSSIWDAHMCIYQVAN